MHSLKLYGDLKAPTNSYMYDLFFRPKKQRISEDNCIMNGGCTHRVIHAKY